MFDIIEDREIYKTCNKFYREFGKLVDDFYKKTLMPDLDKISKENTQWLVEQTLRKFLSSILKILEDSIEDVLSSSSEMSALTYFRSFTEKVSPIMVNIFKRLNAE